MNQEELDKFLKEEKTWSQLKTEHLVKGIKTTFRCNKIGRRVKQCASGIYTLKDPDNGRIKLFRKLAEHDCEQSDSKVKPKVDENGATIYTRAV